MHGSPGLLERQREIAALSDALRRASSGSGNLVIVEGPAGIGKSRLLDVALEEAARAGFETLHARGGELEREMSFAVAMELFEFWPAEGRPPGAVTAIQALMERNVSGLPEPPALIRGLYRLTVDHCTHGRWRPLAIAVDDAQWVDRMSLAFVAYLAARLRELPIALMLAIRSGEPAVAADVLSALRADHALTRLLPASLSEHAVGEIIERTLPGAEPAFVAACARVTAGNPFMTHELAHVLRDDGVSPTTDSAQRVDRLVPASVLHSVLTRVGRLGVAAQRVIYAVAVLGDGALLRRAARLADVEVSDAEGAADRLAAAGILEPGEPLRFAHPLVAAAVQEDMGAFALARAHRDAARLLQDDDAPVHEVAAHLLLTTPDASPAAVATLRSAAARASARGDPHAAAHLLRRALAEPPTTAQRAAVLLELARAEALVADGDAEGHAADAVSLSGEDPRARVQALRVLSQVRVALGQPFPAARALHEALTMLSPDEPQAEEVLAEYLTAHRFSASLLPEWRARLTPIVNAARRGSLPGHPGLTAHVVLELALGGERAGVVGPLAARASAAPAVAESGAHGMFMGLLVQALCCVDDLDAAERIAEAAVQAAHAQGSFMGAAAGCFHRAIVRYHRGQLADALVDLNDAQAPHREGWLAGAPWPQSLQAHVQIARGELDAARGTVRQTWTAGPPPADKMDHGIALFARAQVALAVHDLRPALADAVAAGRHLEGRFGIDHPGLMPWRRTAALAALALGEREHARSLAAEDLERARWSGVPRAIGSALRTAATTAQGKHRLDLLNEAVEVLATSPSHLEHAAGLADLGGALLRAGRRRDAQIPLRAALALADRAGAKPLVETVRHDLRASGARPRQAALTGVDALTPAELRVCRLAASGLTNREIGQELVVTGKTVQTHLAHAYRKLDIASRRELSSALDGSPRF